MDVEVDADMVEEKLEEEEEEEDEENNSEKSNNPHLAGGEWQFHMIGEWYEAGKNEKHNGKNEKISPWSGLSLWL